MNEPQGNIPDNLEMMINANWEAANKMTMDQMAVVIIEGVYNLLAAIGKSVDKNMQTIPMEELIEIGETPNGKIIMESMSVFASAMSTVLISIDEFRTLFPEQYDENVSKFHDIVYKSIEKQKEDIVSEFVRSIPDTIPPEDAASE